MGGLGWRGLVGHMNLPEFRPALYTPSIWVSGTALWGQLSSLQFWTTRDGGGIKEVRWKGLWGNSYKPGEAPLPLLRLCPTLCIDSCREARCPGELSCHAVVCHSRHIIDQAKSFPCLTGRGGGEMSSWHESLGKQVSTDTRQFIFLDSSHFLSKKEKIKRKWKGRFWGKIFTTEQSAIMTKCNANCFL